MDAKEKVLATMKEAGQPLNAGYIAELCGMQVADYITADDATVMLNHNGSTISTFLMTVVT